MRQITVLTKLPRAPSNVRRFPKPYNQGHLDKLCGVYATLSACRNACFGLDPFLRFDGHIFFEAMVSELEQNGQLLKALQHIQTNKQMEICLQTAQACFLRFSRIALTYSYPLPAAQGARVEMAFDLLGQHFERPNASAILHFASRDYVHWIAINEIRAGKLIPSDSARYKPMAVSGFEIEMHPLRGRRYCCEQEGLIFLGLSKLERSSRSQGF